MSLPRALLDFAGHWRVTREIEDARAGTRAEFDGEAWFEGDARELAYREAGRLILPGQAPMQAERRYFWRAADGDICVLFEDLRPFHEFALGISTPEAHHDCPPDSYDVRYDFADWPRWSAVWRVAGPRKDYVMRSHYRRS